MIKANKDILITFLDENILTPAENHPNATDIVKKKVRGTRMRLNDLDTSEKVELFFWNAMTSDNGIDSYTKLKEIGVKTFEDIRLEFKKLCGRK